jgi:hypothetical protein
MPAIKSDHSQDHYRQRLIAALLGIVHGVGATDAEGHPTLVPVLNSVRKTSIFGALGDAALHLDEAFSTQELEIANRACANVGILRTSDRKNQVAKAILEALVAKRQH